MKDTYQTEMPWITAMPTIKFVEPAVVGSWTSKRDAVLWCWKNRPRRGKNEPQDQSMCANFVGMAASHMSRCLNPHTKAPMDIQSHYVKLFEQYTGWRGISQFEMRDRGLTIMEEMISMRAAA